MKKKLFAVRMEEELLKKLDNVSKSSHLTKTAIVSNGVKLWLKEFEGKEEVIGQLLGNQ